MIDNNIVYAEVLGVLFALGNNYVKRLPSNMIDFLLDNCDNNSIPKIDRNVRIEEQNISDEARMLLVAIKLKFWCTSEKERKEIFRIMKKTEDDYKKEIEEKYSTDKLFKKYDLTVVDNSENTHLMHLKNKGIFSKIIDIIKKIIK